MNLRPKAGKGDRPPRTFARALRRLSNKKALHEARLLRSIKPSENA
jgi:hypothetical protein